jgi:hypothetical protein
VQAKCSGVRSHKRNAVDSSLVRLSPLPDAGSRETEWGSGAKQVLQQNVKYRGGSTPSTLSGSNKGGRAANEHRHGGAAFGPGSARPNLKCEALHSLVEMHPMFWKSFYLMVLNGTLPCSFTRTNVDFCGRLQGDCSVRPAMGGL